MAANRLEQLRLAVDGARKILILPHNDPDPDAIASAVALGFLMSELYQIEPKIAYRGIIGRAENRALVRHLGHPLSRLRHSDLHRKVPVALVDTQPGTGNNALPSQFPATIVIDHHPWRDGSAQARFVDVRPDLGATTTIMTEYLQGAGLEPDRKLATVLFYGIKADTRGLSRNVAELDVWAYSYLQPRIDGQLLGQIEQAQVPAEYFRTFDNALRAARVFARTVVISNVGPMDYPDMAAEIADMLMRLEKTTWVVCLGEYRGFMVISVRTRNSQGGAGRLVQAIAAGEGTAGGHGTMAGAQIPLRGRESQALAEELSRRALQVLDVKAGTTGAPLL